MSKRAHSRTGAAKEPEGFSAPTRSNIAQRKCACGAPAGMSGQCAECGRKHSSVQQAAGTDLVRNEVALSPGSPARTSSSEAADRDTQTPADARFGHDFSRIQVLGPDQRGAGDGGEAPKKAAPKAPEKEKEKAPEKEKEKKPAGTTTIGTPARKSYPVTGTTLADAATVIEAREEAGLTEWKPNLSYDKDDQGTITGAAVTVPVTITMPNWPGAAKLSKAAKAEWDRSYAALEAHEQGHVDLVNQQLSGLGQSLVGKTEAEAKAAFQEAVKKLKEASDKYDVDTDHGRKTGTDLDTTIQ